MNICNFIRQFLNLSHLGYQSIIPNSKSEVQTKY